ncbi:hypothetical protein JTE90_002518 [Oedothorax gibbosus]|uniref:Integrase zinc-binding domain-containing protein n=1 Tax=Oedothorax gibbosus TaxID=931172 RepID=A0AAV6TM89_9ARAC|nr:hypothetical protein JTE90_002518 [Oedothorax gibbosus]
MLRESAAQEEIPTVTLHSKKDSLQKIEYLSYFSSYTKIVRMFGWILRFLNNARKTTKKITDENLSTEELKNAEIRLLSVVQDEELTSDYIQTLKLNIFKDDDGLLKVKTKVTEREDTEDFKRPIVLPGKHQLVHLLIREKHLNKLHAGLHIMMSCLHENFWIISGRKTIRKVINQCLQCKRHSSKAVETAPIGLPLDRFVLIKLLTMFVNQKVGV